MMMAPARPRAGAVSLGERDERDQVIWRSCVNYIMCLGGEILTPAETGISAPPPHVSIIGMLCRVPSGHLFAARRS
jgi:hypothetical protein